MRTIVITLIIISIILTTDKGTSKTFYPEIPIDVPLTQENPTEVNLPTKSCTPPHGFNLPQRNNNPLNITYGRLTRKWVDQGLAKREKYLKFECLEDGWQAARELLLDGYGETTIDKMLNRWTNNGYTFGDNRLISTLSEDELNNLIKNMATREGFYAK